MSLIPGLRKSEIQDIDPLTGDAIESLPMGNGAPKPPIGPAPSTPPKLPNAAPRGLGGPAPVGGPGAVSPPPSRPAAGPAPSAPKGLPQQQPVAPAPMQQAPVAPAPEKPVEVVVEEQQASTPPPPPAAAMARYNAPSTQMSLQSGDVMSALEEDGHEGLEMGYGSFPYLKLDRGRFQSSDGNEYGTSFDAVCYPSKVKYIVKCNDEQNAPEFFYTYDKVTTTTGKPVDAILAEWTSKGWSKPVDRKYIDVPAQMVKWVQDGQGNWTPELEQMVLLSIPQTSISRYSGYLAGVKLSRRSSSSEVVTRISVGAKITSGKWPFEPWNFSFVAKLSDFGL